MKTLRILIHPIEIKGDLEDPDTLQQDLYERVQTMVEAETLSYEIMDEEETEDDPF